MSLPFLLNLVIGLIFIYLILSLVASEIQEILTTLLQWRAAHLKKSIEILLTGGEGTANDEKVKKIVKELYDNPLIKNISQESKEGIEAWLRQASRFFVTLGRKDKNTTLNGNEPSYMPSETFASTLLERLNLSDIFQKVTVFNLQRMIKYEILVKVKDYITDENLKIRDETCQALESEFNTFKSKLNVINVDLYNKKTTLLTSINRIRDEIDSFIETSKLFTPSISSSSLKQDSEEQENNPLGSQSQTLSEQNGDLEVTKFIAQLKSLKKGIFYQGDSKNNNTNYNNTDELIRRLQPSPAHILDLVIGEVKVKGQEAVGLSKTYKAFQDEFGNLDKDDEIHKAYEDIKTEIGEIGKRLPDSTRESLAALAKRAEINLRYAQGQVKSVEDEIYQFKTEVQVWFERSMERASGVYKRNAKGIAFLIGFFLAIVVNADTFHIISRLTTDSALREALTTNAELVTKDCLPTQDKTGANTEYLECVRQKVNSSISLPFGRDEANLKQQAEESKGWFWPPLRSFLGWIIMGLRPSR
jgi:phosphoribosylformylglycinamidine (FGAM) synthase PurS component